MAVMECNMIIHWTDMVIHSAIWEVMVFNATFNNISVKSWQSVQYDKKKAYIYWYNHILQQYRKITKYVYWKKILTENDIWIET